MIAGSALLLTSCAVSTPIEVHSTGAAIAAQPMQIAIALPQQGDDALKSRFAAALIQSFADRGLSVVDDGNLVADYAVSIRSAEMGVQISEDSDWLVLPRNPRRFDKCEAMMLRGTLLLLDRPTGSVAYRGQGSAIECEFDDAAIGALADRLVADFIARQ